MSLSDLAKSIVIIILFVPLYLTWVNPQELTNKKEKKKKKKKNRISAEHITRVTPV